MESICTNSAASITQNSASQQDMALASKPTSYGETAVAAARVLLGNRKKYAVRQRRACVSLLSAAYAQVVVLVVVQMLTLHWNHMGTGGNHVSASVEMACSHM